MKDMPESIRALQELVGRLKTLEKDSPKQERESMPDPIVISDAVYEASIADELLEEKKYCRLCKEEVQVRNDYIDMEQVCSKCGCVFALLVYEFQAKRRWFEGIEG